MDGSNAVRLQIWPQWRTHEAHSVLLGWMVLPDQVTIYLVFFGIAINWE